MFETQTWTTSIWNEDPFVQRFAFYKLKVNILWQHKSTIFFHEQEKLIWYVILRNEMETFWKVNKSWEESEGDEERESERQKPHRIWFWHLENMIKNSNQTPSMTRLKLLRCWNTELCVCVWGSTSTEFIAWNCQLGCDPLYSKLTHINSVEKKSNTRLKNFVTNSDSTFKFQYKKNRNN